jgi:hypothetical protein
MLEPAILGKQTVVYPWPRTLTHSTGEPASEDETDLLLGKSKHTDKMLLSHTLGSSRRGNWNSEL